MKYPNIKAAHLSHTQIAKALGYANVKSFRTSSAHQRHMRGVETVLELGITNQTIPGLMKIALSGGGFKPDGKPCKVDMIKLQLNQIK